MSNSLKKSKNCWSKEKSWTWPKERESQKFASTNRKEVNNKYSANSAKIIKAAQHIWYAVNSRENRPKIRLRITMCCLADLQGPQTQTSQEATRVRPTRRLTKKKRIQKNSNAKGGHDVAKIGECREAITASAHARQYKADHKKNATKQSKGMREDALKNFNVLELPRCHYTYLLAIALLSTAAGVGEPHKRTDCTKWSFDRGAKSERATTAVRAAS